ncbi:conserved protein of unknown function [Ruminococcaceae bacterium BL-6]|jgi:hypothetical protein|nr:conserved protein of unknown function [Ruminococcaceae bacterium BL-6]
MQQNDIRQTILSELDSRINRLKEHSDDRIIPTGNRYDELNQSLSKIIGVPLMQELESIKDFVNSL